MADSTTEKPTKPLTSGAESPTTAREPDFDDDPHDTPIPTEQQQQQQQHVTKSPISKKVSFQEVSDEDAPAPPPKPPRPVDPKVEAEKTLVEAFPSVDAKVVKAVLLAGGYNVESAFNALLSMSDPSYVAEETPPAPPPRPAKGHTMTQLESDEMYARQLSDHYAGTTGYGSRGRGEPPLPRRKQADNLNAGQMYDDRDRSFFDDDLPEIKKTIQKGFQETQTTVNKWIMDFKKKLDGDEDGYDQHGNPTAARQSSSSSQIPPPRQDFGPSQSEQLRGIRRSAEQGRRSGDRERYDADPHVLSDDFTQLDLHDNEGGGGGPPRRTMSRPLANPDLFKSTPNSGPVDEVEALYSNPTNPNRQPPPSAGGAKGGKKWQPLTSVAPNPESEDTDPFSLGDSDEEEAKKTDLKPEDSERLKKSASISDGVSAKNTAKEVLLEEAETSGSKNKEAEELLRGT